VTLLAGLVLAPGASAVPGGPISGTSQVGETLTASPAHVYHWQRCNPAAGPCTTSGALWLLDQGWSDIPGAQGHNDRTYTLTEADLGMMIRVLGKDIHLAPFISSPAVGPVTEGAPVNTDPPQISGNPVEGETLTGTDGSWTGSDLSFERQWQRSDGSGGFDDIAGATGSSYALTLADVGHQIRLEVVATGDGGESDPAVSAPTAEIQSGIPVNVTPPAISGAAIEGTTLNGDDGTWSGDNLTFARQWQRSNGSGGYDDIAGATGSSYTLAVADVNRRVRLRVVASSPSGDSDPAFSEPSDVVVNPPQFDSSANLDPISGTVLAKLPGSSQIQQIEELTQVPVGTIVDVSNGFVDLTTQRGPSEGLQTITLWKGSFVFGQRPKNRITVMRLTDNLVGGNARSARTQAQAAGKAGKRLWGRGRCRCRTRGRNSSGTARGTFWLTAERKRGTYTKVKEGVVAVRDFTQNRRVLVHAGEDYLAPKH
jgi:hypothetical protein